jgi:hypothetical protein
VANLMCCAADVIDQAKRVGRQAIAAPGRMLVDRDSISAPP